MSLGEKGRECTRMLKVSERAAQGCGVPGSGGLSPATRALAPCDPHWAKRTNAEARGPAGAKRKEMLWLIRLNRDSAKTQQRLSTTLTLGLGAEVDSMSTELGSVEAINHT